MATSAPGVWAAGDCVECHHRVSNRPVAIALGTHANKQGRVVGINVTGGDATFAGVVGTAVTKICEYEVARTGLNEREARDAGLRLRDARRSRRRPARATTRARAPITVKVVAERGDRAAARRADRRPGRRRQAHRRARDRDLERDDRRRDPAARPRLRAAVLAGVGPGARRRPQRARRAGARYAPSAGLGAARR